MLKQAIVGGKGKAIVDLCGNVRRQVGRRKGYLGQSWENRGRIQNNRRAKAKHWIVVYSIVHVWIRSHRLLAQRRRRQACDPLFDCLTIALALALAQNRATSMIISSSKPTAATHAARFCWLVAVQTPDGSFLLLSYAFGAYFWTDVDYSTVLYGISLLAAHLVYNIVSCTDVAI